MGYGKLRQATGTTTLVVKFYADKAVFPTKLDDKDFLSATARAASTSLYKNGFVQGNYWLYFTLTRHRRDERLCFTSSVSASLP